MKRSSVRVVEEIYNRVVTAIKNSAGKTMKNKIIKGELAENIRTIRNYFFIKNEIIKVIMK